MFNRAERRAAKERMTKRAKRVFPWMEHPQVLADHMKSCSCHMCGNPRKWFKSEKLKENHFKEITVETEYPL